jgi:hypothetical protein
MASIGLKINILRSAIDMKKIENFVVVGVLMISTLSLQGCFEGEQEKAKQAEKQATSKVANDQKALRQRQCEFIGKTATEQGQCVDKR